jgi:hypothetical protein|tara:strand:+ start:1480 stop:1719 length:240 start_codon:yes stop_codon:yes gene_type:complete
MGVSADSQAKAFPSKDVENFFKRVLGDVPVDVMCSISERNTNHIVVSVDPCGGGSSQFAVFSLVQLPSGTIMVCSREIS